MTDTTTTPENETAEAAVEAAKPVYATGSWQDTISKSAALFDRTVKGKAKASSLLWDGAQTAIVEGLDNTDTDPHFETLASDLLDIMGKHRKGDVSKIKTVALAVKNNGLVLAMYPNLSKAYAEANRLTKVVKAQAAEDEAGDKAIEAIAASAPKSSSTPEGAALIVLAKGLDEAARLLLDALNPVPGEDGVVTQNTPAHRSLLRALSQEIAGRIPKPEPKAPAAPKKPTVKKATAKKVASTKAKPQAPGTAAKAKATPVKGKPKPAASPKADAAEAPAPEADDLDAMLDGDAPDETVVEAPAPKKAVVKGRPAVRRPA